MMNTNPVDSLGNAIRDGDILISSDCPTYCVEILSINNTVIKFSDKVCNRDVMVLDYENMRESKWVRKDKFIEEK